MIISESYDGINKRSISVEPRIYQSGQKIPSIASHLAKMEEERRSARNVTQLGSSNSRVVMTPVIDSPKEEEESVRREMLLNLDVKSDIEMVNPVTHSSSAFSIEIEPTITLTDPEPVEPISEVSMEEYTKSVISKAEIREEVVVSRVDSYQEVP